MCHLVKLNCSQAAFSVGRQQSHFLSEKIETVAGSASQQTLHGHRANAVRRHDGEQIPASKNEKLAGSR